MSPEKKQPALRRSWLGRHLKRLREERGMTQDEVARYLRRDKPTVSKFESGVLPISVEDLDGLFDLYNTEPRLAEALQRLRSNARNAAWFDAFGPYTDDDLIDIAWVESMADGIRSFCPLTIDGLLQTPDYARAVMRAADPDESDEQIGRWVELRLQRQAVLARTEFEAIVYEGALLGHVGDRQIAAAQVRHLASLDERGTVAVRLLPFSAGAPANPEGQYRIFDMPEPLSEVVCVDCAAGVLYLESPRTARLLARYDRMRAASLTSDESRMRLQQIADQLTG